MLARAGPLVIRSSSDKPEVAMPLTLHETRIDSPRVPPEQLAPVARIFSESNRKVVKLTDDQGNETELPRELRGFFAQVVSVVANEETVSVTEAARFLQTDEAEIQDLAKWGILLPISTPEGSQFRICDLFRYRHLYEQEQNSKLDEWDKMMIGIEEMGLDDVSVYETR